MAKRPTKSKPKTKKPKMQLVEALDFIKGVQKTGFSTDAKETNCRLANGYAVGFNGVVTMGYPILEDLNACPHTYNLLAALKRCKGSTSLTQVDMHQLVVTSGKFRAVVPCLNPSAIPYSVPDQQVGVIGDTIKKGFSTLSGVVSKSGFSTLETSILLRDNTMVATDRSIIVEYWHGVRLDPERPLVIPVDVVTILSKLSSPLIGIGVGVGSVTFYCDNGAWVKTQTYNDKWPNVDSLLNKGDYHQAVDIPLELFEAVEAVAPFTSNVKDGVATSSNTFFLTGNVVSSHVQNTIGATHEIDVDTEQKACYLTKHMAYLNGKVNKIDYGNDRASYVFGNNIRAVVGKYKY